MEDNIKKSLKMQRYYYNLIIKAKSDRLRNKAVKLWLKHLEKYQEIQKK